MSQESYIYIGIGLIIVLLIIWIIMLQVKLGRLLVGKSKNLDESIDTLKKEIDILKTSKKNTETNLLIIYDKLKKVISGFNTVRFNPFKGTGGGGNQSFASAFVNEDGDGVIISSLYSRDHVSVFSKPISKMHSEYDLTEEEKEALQKAKESIK
jgi:hypothetical protein